MLFDFHPFTRMSLRPIYFFRFLPRAYAEWKAHKHELPELQRRLDELTRKCNELGIWGTRHSGALILTKWCRLFHKMHVRHCLQRKLLVFRWMQLRKFRHLYFSVGGWERRHFLMVLSSDNISSCRLYSKNKGQLNAFGSSLLNT